MGVGRFCLDTSAYANFERGQHRVVEIVDRADWIGVPAIVLGELLAGFVQGTHRDRNEQRLHAFLANATVGVRDVDVDVSHHYADIVRDLRRAGTPIPTNDIWIAATAAAAGATVLTYDAHFESIARVGSVVLEASPG